MAMDEKALYKITYGLYVVSAQAEGQRSGCVVNTLQQVTAEPVRLAVTVNKDSLTCQLIQKAGRFAAVALDQRADMMAIGRFGFRTGRDMDKFEGIPCKEDAAGMPYPCLLYTSHRGQLHQGGDFRAVRQLHLLRQRLLRRGLGQPGLLWGKALPDGRQPVHLAGGHPQRPLGL